MTARPPLARYRWLRSQQRWHAERWREPTCGRRAMRWHSQQAAWYRRQLRTLVRLATS